MNDVETRLRDALATRADALAHDPHAYAAVLQRRSRRNANRFRALAATAATVAAVAAVVVVARPAARRPPVAPATASPSATAAPVVAPAPTVPIGLAGGHAVLWLDKFGRDTDKTRLVGTRVTAVAAFGDSKRFVYAAADERRCGTKLVRWDVTKNQPGSTSTVSHAVRGGDVRGEVTTMAVSPDGRRLAYLMHPAGGRTGGCRTDVAELRVRDLRTGREQAWREPAPQPDRPLMVAHLSSTSWSPDGRYVSAGAVFDIVDTTAADRSLRWADRPVLVGDEWCEMQDRTFRGGTGEVVAYLHCPDTPHTGVHVLDGDRAVRLLIPAPSDGHYVDSGIRFDRSGDHAFLLLGDQAGRDLLYRWDADTGLRPLDTGDDEVEAIAW